MITVNRSQVVSRPRLTGHTMVEASAAATVTGLLLILSA